MPLNADARMLLDIMEQMGAPPLDSLSPNEARAMGAEVVDPLLDPCHETRDLDAGGVPARLYLPEPSDATPGLLVYFHGGGWVVGSIDGHDNVGHALASMSGHAVLSVGYRLAPEHPFPAGLDDCVAATKWAHDNAAELGIDPTRIAVGGDSAGANLATVLCQDAPAPIVFQLLAYPVTDSRMGSDSYTENADGYLLSASMMQWFTDHYLAGSDSTADDPRVSPLLASDEVLAAGPPALVITAGFDPLRDEGVAYADRLAAVGVTTSHVHFSGQIHAFFSLPHVIRDGRSAQALAARALANALDLPPAP